MTLFLMLISCACSQLIKTVVGIGRFNYTGDGGLGVNASLGSPNGVSIDFAGNLFIADMGNNRIRKVDANGTITTIAGNGTSGYGGDGGPAFSAALSSPRGVFVDTFNNIFIADQLNHCIRKLDTNGVISTVAGKSIPSGLTLNEPRDMFVDKDGTIFVADYNHHRIRRVNTNGTHSTVAGSTGSGGYSGDGGLATSAKLNLPWGIFVDPSGNIFISDFGNHCIRKVDVTGRISTIGGKGATAGDSGDGGLAVNATLRNPRGITLFNSELFFADSANHRIRKIDANGIITTVAGTGTYGSGGERIPAVAAMTTKVVGVAVSKSGNLFFSELEGHRIRKVEFECVGGIVGSKCVVNPSCEDAHCIF